MRGATEQRRVVDFEIASVRLHHLPHVTLTCQSEIITAIGGSVAFNPSGHTFDFILLPPIFRLNAVFAHSSVFFFFFKTSNHHHWKKTLLHRRRTRES